MGPAGPAGNAADIAAEIHAATAASLDDADEQGFWQSASSALRKITWANIKAAIKTYADTLYQSILVSGTNIKTINGTSLLGSGDIAAGGLTKFTESQSTTSPNATVYVSQLLATGSASKIDIAITPKGTGALLALVPDGTATYGNKRGTSATDWQRVLASASTVASGAYSTIGGGASNTASGQFSTIAGGWLNVASGESSVVAGGQNNTSTSNFTSSLGGDNNDATGYGASTLGGQNNVASGSYGTTVGGLGNVASGNFSVASGDSSTTRSLTGARAHSSAKRAAVGDNQHIGQVTSITTTGNTATKLTADRGAVSGTNIMVLPNNSSYSGIWVIHARDSSGNGATWWRAFRGKRDANAASTAVSYDADLIAPSIDAGLAGVTAAIVADTTQGGLAVEFTGLAATTIDINAEPFALQIVR